VERGFRPTEVLVLRNLSSSQAIAKLIFLPVSRKTMLNFLGILTNGRITSDNVGPHQDLLSEFPFLGAPHEDRSAQQVTA
jgi:hypothetical protein